LGLKEEYPDFIVYLNDSGEQREAWVRILRADNFVEFETKGGNLILIPYERVLKIKRRKIKNG